MKNTNEQGQLNDIKVIELSNALAGPSAAMFFAELGATVHKYENKTTGGDITRKWRRPEEKGPISSYYAAVNYGKKVFQADLTNPAEHEKLLNDLADTDILITNFKPLSAQKLGLNTEHLKALFPSLIIIQLTGYSEKVHRPAFDLAIQAEAGYMYLNRAPEDTPMKFPFAFTDVMAGLQIRTAALLALYNREKSGKGACISVSLFQSGISGLINQASYYLMTGKQPKPMGSLHPTIAPYGEVFETADGEQFTIAIGTDRQYEKLIDLLDLSPDYNHNRFASNVLRVENRELLYVYLSDSFKLLNWNALESKLLRSAIPFGRIANMKQVFDNELAKQMVKEFVHPEGKIRTVSTIAFQLKD